MDSRIGADRLKAVVLAAAAVVGLSLATVYGALAAAAEHPLAAAHMTTPRILQTATLLPDGDVLIAGGRDPARPGGGYLSTAELFNPRTETFTPAGATVPGLRMLTATSIRSGAHRGDVLIAGNVFKGGFWLAHLEFYEPRRGFVTAPFSGDRRVGPVAVALPRSAHGVILFPATIGRWTGEVTKMTELYDPDSGVMDEGSDMTTVPHKYIASGVAFRAVGLHDGEVLIVGSEAASQSFQPGQGILNSAELYDPRSRAFIPTGNMRIKRENFAATLLKDGRVLISGGDGPAAHSAAIYNPVSQSFTLTPPMLGGHAEHTATLLDDGRVLIAGGHDGSKVSDSAELYDPRRNVFEPAGRMTEPRAFQSATLLKDGRVLIAGGADRDGHALASAALYDPKANRFVALRARH